MASAPHCLDVARKRVFLPTISSHRHILRAVQLDLLHFGVIFDCIRLEGYLPVEF